MIWIRADANSKIGTGHVMRCLSVATALKECGEEVLFLTADDSAVTLLKDKQQDYVVLHTDFDKMEEEYAILETLAKQCEPDLCLIDSYYVTSEYLAHMGELCRIAYMDDVFTFPYAVDILINYNIYGDLLPYHENPGKADMRFLLGTTYAPLRKEFCEGKRKNIQDSVESILITTGGSDSYNLAGQILKEVLADGETAAFCYHVVSGSFNMHLAALQKLAKEHSNIEIHQNVTNMAELMQICDIAITAGGSTMYELCAMGVPIICFSFVENQEKIVETFANKHLVCYGGNYLKEKEGMMQQIVSHLKALAKDRNTRAEYSRKELKLVDGQGARRIAQALMERR